MPAAETYHTVPAAFLSLPPTGMLPIPEGLRTLEQHCPRARSQSLLLAELIQPWSVSPSCSAIRTHQPARKERGLLGSGLLNRPIIGLQDCIKILAKWPTLTSVEPNDSEDCLTSGSSLAEAIDKKPR